MALVYVCTYAAGVVRFRRSKDMADVARGLRISLDEGRSMVARIVSRDTSGMDAPRITRSAIESGAENLSDGVIAPAFCPKISVCANLARN